MIWKYAYKHWVGAVFLAVIISSGSAGYGTASSFCVEEFYTQSAEEQQSGLVEKVQALVDEIRQKLAMSRPVKVISCGQARKAVAVDRGLTKATPRGNYLVFDPIWVNEVIGEEQSDPVKKTEAVALFGHELGHFINGHLTEPPQRLPREVEAEADQTAGCAVARMARSWRGLRNLLSRIRQRKDESYPDRLTSLASARQGFINCGGTPDAVELILEDHLQYGIGDEVPNNIKLNELNNKNYFLSEKKELDGSDSQNAFDVYAILYEIDSRRRVMRVLIYFVPEYVNADMYINRRILSFSSYSSYFVHMGKFIDACGSRLRDVANSISEALGSRIEVEGHRPNSSDFLDYKHLGVPLYKIVSGEYIISGAFFLREVTPVDPQETSDVFLDNWFYDNENLIVMQRAYCQPVFSIKVSK
ncbi:hypothetical protein GOB99_15335 [Sinorhizobium meliloti]|nr:hypothetical protein [Sinorhizobium meliloti]MDX0238250.1 hypothetical protein [Sinorhizobium meliloti]